jgi:cathepsin L
MHLFVLVLFALLAIAAAARVQPGNGTFMNPLLLSKYWNAFKASHGKAYSSVAEETKRRKVFVENLLTVMQSNLEFDLGLKSYKLGVNTFADLTNDEYQAKMGLKKKQPAKPTGGEVLKVSKRSIDELPQNIDWRTASNPARVGPVQDQGQCGSCWAFSTIASVEGVVSKASNEFVKLSEQELVDCDRTFNSQGCNGGNMVDGFNYVISSGISRSESYPKYEAKDNSSCRVDNAAPKTPKKFISNYVEIPQGDAEGLRYALATVGPVSVAIDAGSPFFQFYESGVYDDIFCSADQLNLGVVAVGYDTTSEGSFWIVRNSWSSNWGENGYIRMARGRNLCGINEMASYPIY